MGINREKEVRTGNHFKNQNASPFCPGKIPLDYMPTMDTGNFLPVLYRAFEGWCSGALWWAFWFLKRPASFSSFFLLYLMDIFRVSWEKERNLCLLLCAMKPLGEALIRTGAMLDSTSHAPLILVMSFP